VAFSFSAGSVETVAIARLQDHRTMRGFAISTVWRRKRILPMLGRKTTADYGMGLAPIFFSEIFGLDQNVFVSRSG
jgi:hypothetical protein